MLYFTIFTINNLKEQSQGLHVINIEKSGRLLISIKIPIKVTMWQVVEVFIKRNHNKQSHERSGVNRIGDE